MAVRFYDGFDDYTWTASSPPGGEWMNNWTGTSGSGGGSAAGPTRQTGRNGQGMTTSASNLEMLVWKTIDSQSTWIVGAAWKKLGAYSGNTPIIGFHDGANTQAWVYHDGTNFYLYRGSGSTLLATYANALSTNVWYYFEVKWIGTTTPGGTTGGTFEMKIDGTVVLTYSGDTCQGAANTADTIYLGGDRSQTGSTTWDDVYMCDGTGSVANDYLGDIKVETLLPNADGTYSTWVGSDGNSTNNYLLVDEATQAVADYVVSATPGNKDTYNFGSLATTSGTVYAVNPKAWCARTDAGPRTARTVTSLSGGTEEEGTITTPTGISYSYVQDMQTEKPGGGAWSISDVNAAEFGIKIEA